MKKCRSSLLAMAIFLVLSQFVNAGTDTFTINVPNPQGGYTAIVVKKSGSGYIGPNGQYFPKFPKVDELQADYGLGTKPTEGGQGNFVRTNDIMFALSPQITIPPDSNTLFSLDIMEVMQSADGGVLMRIVPGLGQDQDIIAFLYTDENFVDGVRLAGYWAYYVGTYKYQTVLGVQKNVYAFKMFDKSKGFELTRRRIEAQRQATEMIDVKLAAQSFVNQTLGNNCVQYWRNSAQRYNMPLFSLLSRLGNTSVCINESKQFGAQPTVIKTGDNRWTVSSYVEGRDGTLPNQIAMIRVYYTVDLTLPPSQEAILNNLRFYNKQPRAIQTSANGYISVAP